MLLSNVIYSKVSFMGLRGGHPLPLQTYVYIQYIHVHSGVSIEHKYVLPHTRVWQLAIDLDIQI